MYIKGYCIEKCIYVLFSYEFYKLQARVKELDSLRGNYIGILNGWHTDSKRKWKA